MTLQTNGKPRTAVQKNSIVEEFDDLVVQMRDMLDSLQGRVSNLTSDMQTVSEIATRVAGYSRIKELLPEVVEEVKAGFNLHHVNIYMLDEARMKLILTAASGEEGRKLLDQNYNVAFNDEHNIAATAARTHQALISNDVENDREYDFSDLIPGTKAKMAVPMITRGRVIGVMSVQKAEVNSFDDTDVRVKTTLAEQLAVTIESAEAFTDLEAAQSEASSSQQLLQSVLDNITVRVFAKDLEGRYVFANKLFLQDASLENADDIVGKTDFELPWAETEAEDFRKDDLEVMDNDQPKLGIEEPQTQADGSVIWLSTNKVPLHDRDGNVTGVLGMYEDITERRRSEERETLAYEIGQQLNTMQDPQELLQFAVDILADALNYYHAHIYLFNRQKNYMEVVAGLGEAGRVMVQEHHSIAYEAKRSLVASAARSLEPVVVADVGDDSTHLPNPLIPNTQSEAALPLFVGSELLGVLDIQADRPDAFDEDELRLLTVIASQLSIALSNARQLEETEQRLRDIALANQASQIINETDNVKDMLSRILELVSNALGADSAAFTEWDILTERWRGTASFGMDPSIIDSLDEPREVLPHGWIALDNDQVVAIDDAPSYPNFPMGYAEQIGIKSVAVMPVVGRQGKIGVAFFNYGEAIHNFTDNEVTLLDGLSRQLSIGIEAKRFAEQNERQLRDITLANQANQIINETDDVVDMLEEIQALIAKAIGADSAGYANYIEEADEWRGVCGYNMTREFAVTLIFPGPAYPHGLEALDTGRTVAIDNVNEYKGFPVELIESIGIKSVIAMPMIGRNRKVGVAFFNYGEDFHQFDENEVALLDRIAQQVSLGIESKQNAAANIRLRDLTNSSRDFVATAHAETLEITFVNQGGVQMLGYELADEVVGNPIPFVHTDAAYQKIVEEALPTLMNGEPWVGETELLTKDGMVIPVEQQLYPVYDDRGNFIEIGTNMRDIRERKEAEAERNRIYEMSIDMIGTASFDGYFKDLNPSWERVLGFKPQELMSEPFISFVHPDDVESTNAEAAKLADGVAAINFVNRYQTKDGGWRWLNWNSTPDYEKQLIYFVAHDITEQRERQLERERIYNMSTDMIGSAGFDGYFRDLNPSWLTKLGWTEAEMKSKPFIELVHPDDIEKTMTEAQKLAEGETTISFVNRYPKKDGGWLWLSWNASADLENEMYYFVVRDITDEREQQELVIQRAAELQIVADVATQASTILNLDEMLLNVVELSKHQFDLYHAHIYFLEGDSLILAAGAGDAGKRMKDAGHRIPLNQPNSVVAQAARSAEGVISNDVTASGHFLPNPLLPKTRAELAVPLLYNREVIGVFDVQSTTANRFTEEDLNVQTILAGQIAVAVQNARTFAAEQEVRESNELLAQISRNLSAAIDEDEILLAIQQLIRTSNVDFAALAYTFDLDPNGQPQRFVTQSALSGNSVVDVSTLPAYEVTPDNYPILKLMLEQPDELLFIEDGVSFNQAPTAELEQELSQWQELTGDQTSLMFVPLRTGREWLGYIVLTWSEQEPVPDNVRDLISRVQGVLATTVDNRRTFLREQALSAENERRAREMETVAQVTTASSTILDVNKLLKQVADLTKSAFDLYHAHIYLYDEDNEIMRLAAGAGEAGDMMKINHHSIPLRHETSIVAQAARDRRGIRVNDVTASPTFLPNPILPETRSEIALPMMVGTRLIGVLDVQSEEPNHFTDEDIRIKSTLASQVAVAVQNALAYEESQEVAERLREVDRLKSQFLASMSHELRTPLNSIIGYSEVLLDGGDGDLSEDAVEDVEIIYTSGRHLLAIINDILDLAKIEANQMKLHKDPTDMVKILRDVIKTNQVLIGDKPIELGLESDIDELIVPIDDLRIRQVVLNLFSNAVKFTEEGSVKIHLSMLDDQTAKIAVVDTGIGISEEGMAIVFDQFRQVDGSSTRKAGGTGLGLTITRYLVEMHGGEIHVESTEGEGSVFWFTLPLVETEADPAILLR